MSNEISSAFMLFIFLRLSAKFVLRESKENGGDPFLSASRVQILEGKYLYCILGREANSPWAFW
jgi:hypothetical protein